MLLSLMKEIRFYKNYAKMHTISNFNFTIVLKRLFKATNLQSHDIFNSKFIFQGNIKTIKLE